MESACALTRTVGSNPTLSACSSCGLLVDTAQRLPAGRYALLQLLEPVEHQNHELATTRYAAGVREQDERFAVPGARHNLRGCPRSLPEARGTRPCTSR